MPKEEIAVPVFDFWQHGNQADKHHEQKDQNLFPAVSYCIQALTAEDARQVSGYAEIDYSIAEDATVLDAVQKFAAYNIGCLVTTDPSGTYGKCILRNILVRGYEYFEWKCWK